MTCKTHPDAPHGFVRSSSHTLDRDVCECEFWEPPAENKCDCADKSQCWEPCGELGKSEAHAEVFDFQQTLKPNDGVKT